MTYIINDIIDVPPNNHRFTSAGFEAGKNYRILNIRYNREAKKIEYRFSESLMVSFDSTQEADAFFDRIKGITRTKPVMPLVTEF